MRMMALVPLAFSVGIVLLASAEPVQVALSSEDECSAWDDCAVNALQHKAVKAQTHGDDSLEVDEGEHSDEEMGAALREDIMPWKKMTLENVNPAALKMVDEYNRRFNSADSGVYQRLVYGANPRPWINHGPTISFALMNKAAWNPVKQQITIFDFHGAASGFIASTEGLQPMLLCSFPCDGYSDHRVLGQRGCGCGDMENMKDFPCPQAGQADWCDYFGDLDTNFTYRAKGTPCAFKPTETAKMLKYYAEVKKGRAPEALQKSCNAWGQGADGSAAWNEAVVDAAAWRKDGRTQIEAIVVPSTCYKSIICRNDVTLWYGRFKLWNGPRPVVYMDLDKHDSPYQILGDGVKWRYPTDEAWPPAAATTTTPPAPPAPPPPAPAMTTPAASAKATASAACADHSGCSHLQGNCCPTNGGVNLGCCN